MAMHVWKISLQTTDNNNNNLQVFQLIARYLLDLQTTHGGCIYPGPEQRSMYVVGIAAWTCHQPSSVFDVVPGDLVSATILAAAAATTQVSHMRRLSCCTMLYHALSCIVCQQRITVTCLPAELCPTVPFLSMVLV